MSVCSSEIPTKSPGTLNHPLTLANPTSGSKGPSSRVPPTSIDTSLQLTTLLSLLCSVDCPVLSTSFFCCLPSSALSGTLFPSSSSGLVGNLARKTFVWVSYQNRQTYPLTGINTHRNECHPSCHTCCKFSRVFFVFLSLLLL